MMMRDFFMVSHRASEIHSNVMRDWLRFTNETSLLAAGSIIPTDRTAPWTSFPMIPLFARTLWALQTLRTCRDASDLLDLARLRAPLGPVDPGTYGPDGPSGSARRTAPPRRARMHATGSDGRDL